MLEQRALLLMLFAFTMALPVSAFDMSAMKRSDEPAGMEYEKVGAGLYAHDKIYLIGGGSPDFDLKFQVSFKARVWRDLYLGYTQLNAWDVSKVSSPFRDTTHRPSLFWYPPRDRSNPGAQVHYSGGYEHNSNGKDGPASRSLDMLYLRPLITVGAQDDRYWRIKPKFFHYLKMSSNNADITRYRDVADLEVANTDEESWSASAYFRAGRSGLSSTQVEVSQSLRKIGWDVPGYLYLQVFRGYGETLLDYNQKVKPQVRMGYLFERGY